METSTVRTSTTLLALRTSTMTTPRYITLDQFDPKRAIFEAAKSEESRVTDDDGKRVNLFRSRLTYKYPDPNNPANEFPDKLRILFPPRLIKLFRNPHSKKNYGDFGNLKPLMTFNQNDPEDLKLLQEWGRFMRGLGESLLETGRKAGERSTLYHWTNNKHKGSLVPDNQTFDLGAMYASKPFKDSGEENKYYVPGEHTLYLDLPYRDYFLQVFAPSYDGNGAAEYRAISSEQVRGLVDYQFRGQIIAEVYQAKITASAAAIKTTAVQIYIQDKPEKSSGPEMGIADIQVPASQDNIEAIRKTLESLELLSAGNGETPVTEESAPVTFQTSPEQIPLSQPQAAPISGMWSSHAGPDVPPPVGVAIPQSTVMGNLPQFS